MVSEDIESIHLIAIGGTGVAPLACLLRQEGYQVRGSDGALYPPMSTLLADHGIEPLVGFDRSHLQPTPDLVIVGNAVPRHNPEALETERLGIERISMPQALYRFFLESRQPLVISGTHGKTTTTALAASVYTSCDQDPGYLIGGLPLDLEASFARGSGPRFIIEGDEYNAAYFDRGPKFLHYRPQTLILTGVEHDHVDLYPDSDSFREAFRRLIAILPAEGLLIVDGDTDEVRELARSAPCEVVLYGLGEHNQLRPSGEIAWGEETTRFTIEDSDHGRLEIELGVGGEHNVRNALAVWAATRSDRLPIDRVLRALRDFRGVQRRLETVGEAGGVLVVDDFAHHPTEIGTTLGALRQRHPQRRLVVIFEPRSITSGRSFFFDAYLRAFSVADVALIAPIHYRDRLQKEERIDLDELTRRLGDDGTEATFFDELESLEGFALANLRPGDVVVTMSSGNFADLPRRLLGALRASPDESR
jgi:UDP-N-acetylmuramate: L-alanyl-gamma-D-glutamyl-meso-diaminopimelate ligase